MFPPLIEALIESFAQLPGIGRKSAERIAFYVLDNMTENDVEKMAHSIIEAKKKVCLCPICQNLTDSMPCKICSSEDRDRSVICVVENPKDVIAIEKTKEYKGLYHVLHGALSPMDGISPEDIKIKELLERLTGDVKEIIMATNPTVSGTATAVYLSKLISPMNIKVSRIAHGIPVGGDIEYADEVTLIKAIEGRQLM